MIRFEDQSNKPKKSRFGVYSPKPTKSRTSLNEESIKQVVDLLSKDEKKKRKKKAFCLKF